mmetsp:Transcript_5692/g.21482  ORF Transcript_5692/g.21482 Transcript_5692/m.21482 type:complete len:142 (+) Transcript_5692:3021-3446(+)
MYIEIYAAHVSVDGLGEGERRHACSPKEIEQSNHRSAFLRLLYCEYWGVLASASMMFSVVVVKKNGQKDMYKRRWHKDHGTTVLAQCARKDPTINPIPSLQRPSALNISCKLIIHIMLAMLATNSNSDCCSQICSLNPTKN